MSLLAGSPTCRMTPLEMRRAKSSKSIPKLTWAPLIEFRRMREEEKKRKERARLRRKSPNSGGGDSISKTRFSLDPVDEASLSPSARSSMQRPSIMSFTSKRGSMMSRKSILSTFAEEEDRPGSPNTPNLTEKLLNSVATERRASDLATGHRPHLEIVDTAEEAFVRLQVSGVVTQGAQLASAMCLLGHQFPNNENLNEIIRVKVRGRESLDEADFVLVVDSYEEDLMRFLQGVMVADYSRKDGLPELMSEAGVPFMCGAMEEFGETFEGIEDEEIDVQEFRTMYLSTFQKAGLTNSEYQRLVAYHADHKDVNGLISEEACRNGLKWHHALINLAGGEQVLEALTNACLCWSRTGNVELNPRAWTSEKTRDSLLSIQRPSSSASGSWGPGGVTLSAFLAGSRTLHELISKGLERVYLKLGMDPSVPFETSSETLCSIIEEVGFFGAIRDNIQVFMELVSFHEKETISFDLVFALVLHYALANGLTPSERQEIEELFKRFDDDGSGTLDASEIGPLIRWLGYQPSKYRVYDFCEGFGITETSEVDIDEFVELVSKYQEYSLKLARSIFYPNSESRSRLIGVDELGDTLRVVGYDPSRKEIVSLKKSTFTDQIDFSVFKQLEATHRKHVIRCMEANGGLTDPELNKHRQYFEDHDPGRTGNIGNDALRTLFATLFPDKLQDKEFHVKVAKMIKEADADGNGKFDFEEYLDLMKQVTQEIDRDVLMQGLKLGPELGYSRAEVGQLRDLYRACDDDMSGSIEFAELKELFGNLVDMNQQAEEELREMFLAVDDGDGTMDFWEFMKFMKSIQAKNWRNINGDS